MSLRSAIQSAVNHLNATGARSGSVVQLAYGEALESFTIADAELALIAPPESVIRVYQELGNGFRFDWIDAEVASRSWTDDMPYHITLQLPPLGELCNRRHLYINGWYVSADFSTYNVADAALAHRTASRIVNWTWFYEEMNGDCICVDFSTGEVVYDQHDWHDAGTGANGEMLSTNLYDFLISWASICFVPPDGHYWQDVFSPSGIDWESELFNSRYRIGHS